MGGLGDISNYESVAYRTRLWKGDWFGFFFPFLSFPFPHLTITSLVKTGHGFWNAPPVFYLLVISHTFKCITFIKQLDDGLFSKKEVVIRKILNFTVVCRIFTPWYIAWVFPVNMESHNSRGNAFVQYLVPWNVAKGLSIVMWIALSPIFFCFSILV